MENGPNAKAEMIGGKWFVGSPYWRFSVADEDSANRAAAIINQVYELGKRDKVNEIRNALLLGPYDNGF